MSWQQQPYYPGQQGPPPPGFYPGGVPPGGPGYPAGGPGYPAGGPGYPAGGPGYPQQPGGGGFAPPPSFGGGYVPPAGPPPTSAMPNYPYEDPGDGGLAFSDKTIRMGFIRKVYGILMCQLLVTFGLVAVFQFSDGAKRLVATNPIIFILALVIMIVTMLSLACCESVRRKAPMNFIVLGLFTIAEGFLLGVSAARFHSSEVILAVGITTVVVFGLTVFAFQTKIDFTAMGGILMVCCLVLLGFGILRIFWNGPTITLIYASCGALLFSVYIVYDTQIMIGGNHKCAISPEEYIFAALNLYTDIVNLFLYILTIIGTSRD